MPLISKHFPGINPLTVYDLTLDWWRVYVLQAKAIDEAAQNASRKR